MLAIAARLTLAVLLVQGISVGNAHAQDWTGILSIDGAAGYDDNIAPSIDGNEKDYFLQLSPRAQFRYETPRSINEVSYNLSAFFYEERSDSNSLAHTVQLSTEQRLTPRSLLQLRVALSAGQLNTLQLAASPENAPAPDLASDTSDFVSLAANQQLRWRIDPATTMLQSYALGIVSRRSALDGLEISRGTQLSTGLGVEREWTRDNGRLSFGVGMLDLVTNRDCQCADISTLSQFDFSIGARWQRSLNTKWTSTIDGGITLTKVPGTKIVNPLRPSAAAELAYFDDWGGLVLAYQHTIEPSLTTAQNTTSDEASLRAWLPVPYLRGDGPIPRVAFTTSLGAQYGRIIDLESNASPPDWTAVFFDASILWMIREPSLFLSVRYVHTQQRGQAGSVASYDRNIFTVSISGALSKGRPQPAVLRSNASDSRNTSTLENR